MYDHIPVYVAAHIIDDPALSHHLYDRDPNDFARVPPGAFVDAANRLGYGRFKTPPAPFVYPPFCAWLSKPLTLISYETSRRLLLVVTAVCLILSILLIHREVAPRLSPWILFVVCPAALAFFGPLHTNSRQGQISPIILLLICSSLALLNRRRETLAGLLLGFITAFKITPAAFLVLHLPDRRFRAVAAAAATAVGLFAGGVVLSGWRLTAEYFSVVATISARGGVLGWHNQTFQTLLLRFVRPLWAPRAYVEVPAWVAVAEKLLVLAIWIGAVAVLYSRRQARRTDGPAQAERNAVLFGTATFLSILSTCYAWDHYHIYLLLPALWVLARLTAGRRLARRRLWIGVAAVAWVLISSKAVLALRLLLLFKEADQPPGPLAILLSAPLIGVVLLFSAFLALAWRELRPAGSTP